MPATLGAEAQAIATIYASLLGVAGPLAWVCWRVGQPLPPEKPSSAILSDERLIWAFGVQYLGALLIIPLLIESGMAPGKAGETPATQTLLLATAISSAIVLAICYQRPSPMRWSLRSISRGLVAWMLIHPIVFACYAITLLIYQWIGGTVDEHPMLQEPLRAGVWPWFTFLIICGIVPAAEEVAYRGRLFPWLIRHPEMVISILIASVVLTALTAKRPEAIGFALVVAALAAAQRRPVWRAIVATSALFAAGHASVWPSPIPLFVLAILLSWLTFWHGSILPAIVVHGLFNAVSLIFVYQRS